MDLRTAIKQVIKKNKAAIVHIEGIGHQKTIDVSTPFKNDPFFSNVPKMSDEFKRELKELGTGMLIDHLGHVLTSSHIVIGVNTLHVLLTDGRIYPASFVGADPKTDLAIIRILADGPLPNVTFGDSDRVEAGDWVVAIGCTHGLINTVAQGIISSKHRTNVRDPSAHQDLLKTDVAINPINIGGPLFSLCGEVIGINVAIVSESDGSKGINFAIPSNIATHITKELLDHGRVTRSSMGVKIQDLTPELAQFFGLKKPAGALITHVVKGGPADKASIKKGDVVIGYRGKKISNRATLQNEVAASPIGKEVTITVFRNRKKQMLTVMVGDSQKIINRPASSIKGRLGIDVRPVTSQELERYGLGLQRGLVITSVHPDSPLVHIGFEVKDMILEVNGRPINDMEDFAGLINALGPEQQIIMLGLDHRSGRSGYVQVKVP